MMDDDSRSLKVWVVNAFVEERLFSGNPAAVCPLADWLDDGTLQSMAEQHNLAETAFTVPRGDGVYGLCWFTPNQEVDLCGHATLAAAHVLFKQSKRLERICFETRSGELVVTKQADGLLEMNFPQLPLEAVVIEPNWESSFGPIRYAGRNALGFLVLELSSVEAVQDYVPCVELLSPMADLAVNITACSDSVDSGFDFVSRLFAPNAGIPEDPVTGAAHCSLFPYWAQRKGKERMSARQVSSRGGIVEGQLAGDRVRLIGRCQTYLEGRILL